MLRLGWWGPRSLMRTFTQRPFLSFVTFTPVPKGNVRCAAVITFLLKVSPLAVLCPWHSDPYQDAHPCCCGMLVFCDFRLRCEVAHLRFQRRSMLSTIQIDFSRL